MLIYNTGYRGFSRVVPAERKELGYRNVGTHYVDNVVGTGIGRTIFTPKFRLETLDFRRKSRRCSSRMQIHAPFSPRMRANTLKHN